MRNVLSFILLATVSLWASEGALPDELLQKYFQKEIITTKSGELLSKIIINGPPVPPLGFKRSIVNTNIKSSSTKTIVTPAYDWSFGCAATSAAMMAGYYDRNGYPDVYTGPTAGGVAPLDNSAYGTVTINGNVLSQTPLSATRNGLDGRTTRGHVDDYWVDHDNMYDDPWYGHWTEHTYGDCTGDYMKTNQWYHDYENPDGATPIYTYEDGTPLTAENMEANDIENLDGAYGLKLFFQSRGYTVTTLYTQKIDPNEVGGFSFVQYMAEIDANHPVLIHVQGHTMLGVGYDNASNTVYLHDTWDYNTHSMAWGGSYTGMAHYAVSVIHITKGSTPTTLAPVYYLLGM